MIKQDYGGNTEVDPVGSSFYTWPRKSLELLDLSQLEEPTELEPDFGEGLMVQLRPQELPGSPIRLGYSSLKNTGISEQIQWG